MSVPKESVFAPNYRLIIDDLLSTTYNIIHIYARIVFLLFTFCSNEKTMHIVYVVPTNYDG